MNFFSKVYHFFSDPNTPGSAFYMALVPMVSSVGDYFLGSGNPVLMGIGAAISGIYSLAHYLGHGIAAKQGPVVAAVPTGPPTVNDTAFGVPKVGPDYASQPPAGTVAHPF